MAAAKAGDAVYHIDPPAPAKKLRELLYSAFYVTDHTTHFYILGGPDFIVGPEAPPEQRNIVGVIQKVGLEIGKRVAKICRNGFGMRVLGNQRRLDRLVALKFLPPALVAALPPSVALPRAQIKLPSAGPPNE